MDAKRAGDIHLRHRQTCDEMGGSHYSGDWSRQAATARRSSAPSRAASSLTRCSRAMGRGLVRACHDCAEGGSPSPRRDGVRRRHGRGRLHPDRPARARDRPRRRDPLQRIATPLPGRRSSPRKSKRSNPRSKLPSCNVRPRSRTEISSDPRRHRAADLGKHIGELKEAWQKPLRW